MGICGQASTVEGTGKTEDQELGDLLSEENTTTSFFFEV